MKIAFVSQPIDIVTRPSPNSIGIWTSEVAHRMAKTNDVIIFARSRNRRIYSTRNEEPAIRFKLALSNSLLMRISRKLPWLSSIRRPFFSSPLYNLEYALQVALDLQQQRCDIVHVQNLSHFVPIIRAFNPNVKIVLHMHCEWLTQFDHRMIEQRIKKADLILGCSDYITHSIQDHFPAYASNCQTIYNGVDPKEFSGTVSTRDVSQPKKLLLVGRVSPEKGVHTLVEAFSEVARQFPDVNLEIIGPLGPVPIEYIVQLSDDPYIRRLDRFYQSSYFRTIREMIPPDLIDRVNFPGFVKHADLVERYRSADILINPSLSESFGMSLIEAMACEVPVVATRVGGMQDVVLDGQTGILVEPENPKELASAISRLLSDPSLRSEMGKAGKMRVVNQFSWETITSTLMSEYQNLFNGGRQGVHKKAVEAAL